MSRAVPIPALPLALLTCCLAVGCASNPETPVVAATAEPGDAEAGPAAPDEEPDAPAGAVGTTVKAATAQPADLPDVAAPTLDLPEAGVADRVAALADRYVSEYFARHPHRATMEGYPGADHARLPARTPEAVGEWVAVQNALLAGLEEVDRAGLTGSAATTYDFLAEQLRAGIAFHRDCRMDLWDVSPTWTGWQADFAYLAGIQPVATPEERAAAAARTRDLARYLAEEIANLRAGLAAGYSAPKTNVERVVEQMNGLLAQPVPDSPFYAPARRARDQDPRFASEMGLLVTRVVYPAIKRYRDFLRDEYLPAARADVAVAANPGGEACYRAAVRYHTSLDITPEEIHRIGLEQMERITAEMRTIGERSFGEADPKALLTLVKEDPRYTFESRDAMLAYAESAVRRAEAAVPGWFGLVPRAPVVVEPYPAFREASAPGAEYNSAPDADTPATYYINLYHAEEQSKAGVEATAFHEAYPGHHLQISIAKERQGTPDIQRYFGTSGFTEGWALYTERLADEMGLYTGDLDRLGLLSNEALRAARLVVDSGMHALGWSRERAIEYLAAHTTETPSHAASEIDRYIAVPGQATSYMLGNLEIRRLREMAEAELGDAFDIEQFHDRVLEDGAVTLAMLREKIERWVREASP